MANAREDMSLVCRTAVDFAFKQIEKHGDFIPFAVAIDRKGALSYVALGEDIVEDGGEKDLAMVRKILRAGVKKGNYSVTAVASDVRIRMNDSGEITDALRIEVEHVNDDPMTQILPYRKKKKSIEQHIDPYFQAGERIIFA